MPSRTERRAREAALRAVTVRQPWACHLVFGGLDALPRRTATPHRGLVLIHAARTEDHAAKLPAGTRERPAPDHPGDHGRRPEPWPRHSGLIFGVGHLVDCSRAKATPSGDGWLWRFAGVRPLSHPMPARGHPGLWKPHLGDVRVIEATDSFW